MRSDVVASAATARAVRGAKPMIVRSGTTRVAEPSSSALRASATQAVCEGTPAVTTVKRNGWGIERVLLSFNTQVERVKRSILVELLGFFLLFTCLIRMRFGL